MTTPYGAVALSEDIRNTRAQLKELADVAQQGVALADTVLGPENLGFRIAKGEAPKEKEIAPLQAQFARLKAKLDALNSAIEVKTVKDYTKLASAEAATPIKL